MAATQWYVVRDGQQVGPVPLDDLRDLAARDDLRPTDLLRPVGSDGPGREARLFRGLVFRPAAARAAPVPPPLPPSAPPKAAASGLVTCEKCNGRVSDVAPACPHCGHPQPKGEAEANGWVGGPCGFRNTYNVLSTEFAWFREGRRCRGCDRLLPECNPSEHLDAEMDKVYRDAVEVAPLEGWAAVVVAFVVSRPAAPDGPGVVGGLIIAAVAYFVATAIARFAVCRLGLADGLHRSPLASSMRGRSWDEVDYRFRRSRDPKSGSEGRAAGGFPWGAMVVAAIVVVEGAVLYQAQLSDYAQGRKAGVRHVRETSLRGPFIRAGMNIANTLDLIPSNPAKSPDWNAGFRQGVREELERMYPSRPK